jgi:hypothetical protein
MSSTTHNKTTNANGLAPLGITLGMYKRQLVPKPKRPTQVTFVALTYSAKELDSHPELEARLKNISEFFKSARQAVKGTDYKFSCRGFLLALLEREIENYKKPPTS